MSIIDSGMAIRRVPLADFLSITVDPCCEKEGDKKERRTSEKEIVASHPPPRTQASCGRHLNLKRTDKIGQYKNRNLKSTD
jgi:hypothetical protein